MKNMVGEAADRNVDNEDASILGKFRDTLENHELPSFEEFQQNFAAQGGYILDEGNGLHFFTFGLKPGPKRKEITSLTKPKTNGGAEKSASPFFVLPHQQFQKLLSGCQLNALKTNSSQIIYSQN